MAEKVDAITLEIEATTEKADKGIDKTIESLKALKTALNGINTKKLKQEMESFEDFQKKLQTAFSDIKISGNTEELKKQIAQAEARLDTLLNKENKLKTVSGINENSKQYRNLQYDIAQVCSSLDQMYTAMDRADTQKPLNFWEKPNWEENLQNYGTTDGSVIKSRLGSAEDVEKIESVATYAANNIKQSFAEVAQAEEETAQKVKNLGGKMQGLKGIVEQLKTTFSGIREKMSLGSGAEKFNADMQNLIDGMNQAKYTMKQMESGAKAFDSTAYKRAAQDLAEASAQMQKYKSSLTGATEQTSRLKTVLSGIGGVVKGAFSKVGEIGSGIVSSCKKAAGALSGLKSQISKLGTAFSGLGKKIGAITKLFSFMVLRRAITALLNTVKQGFDTLAQYSAAKGTEFNDSISMMQSSLKTLGNSLVVAFEPIINVVAPILTAFIDKLTAATNAIGQFFAALTGKATFTHAKKVVGNYAASLDKATTSTKKLATATAGIDELNILQDNSDSGGNSGASNPADSFETEKVGDKFTNLAQMIKDAWEKTDFSELGTMLAEKINVALEGINWAKIKDTSRKIAQSIGTFVNGFVGCLNWTLIGSSVAEGINTALIFANTLLSTIDFGLIGRSLATGLNSAVNVIDWQVVGVLLSNGFNSVIDLLYDFVSTFDYTNLGESIGTAITTAIKNIKWNKGGSAIGKAVTGLFDTFNGFIKKTDFATLGKGIVSAIGGFFENLSWSSIGAALSNAITALANFVYGLVSDTDWAAVPQYIVDSIKKFFTSFDWSSISKSLGQLLGSAIKGAVDFAGSIWDILKSAWGNLSDYFNDYIQDAGGDIIAGLWNGIINALKNVGAWIKNNIFQPFIDGFKNAFGIHSPSKEMQTMGGYIVDGLILGISGKFSECQAKVLEWAEKIKDWFSGTSFGKICKSTWETYGQNIIGAFKDKIGNTYTSTRNNVSVWASDVIKQVTKADIQRIINAMALEGKKHSTFANLKSCLNVVFECAVDDDIILKNPAKNIQLPQTGSEKIKPVPEEHIKIFLEYVHNSKRFSYSYPAFLVLFNVGLRNGELSALTWDDIDFKTSEIRINKSLNRYRKKDYGFTMAVGSPKSKTSVRTIIMNDTVKIALMRLKMQRGKETPILPCVDDSGNVKGEVKDFVFLNNSGNVWIEPVFRELIIRITEQYNKEAEAKGREKIEVWKPHQSRHSYTSLAYSVGADMKAVSHMLGHNSINTTMNVYAELTEEKKKEQEALIKSVRIS